MNKVELFKKSPQIGKRNGRKGWRLHGSHEHCIKKGLRNQREVQSKLEFPWAGRRGEAFGKARIYINTEKMGEVFGLEINLYNTGNISSAHLNGEDK